MSAVIQRAARARIPIAILVAAMLMTPLVSQPAEGVSPGVDVVYVADGRSFADALVGAALAAANNTSVLTVAGTKSGDFVPDATKAELTRLEPVEIIILGGDAAVSQAVEDELGTYTKPTAGNTSRLFGSGRYATAAEISKAIPDAVKKAQDADTVDGMHAGDFALSDQACSAGQVVTGIAANGTPTCAADDVDGGDADTLDGMDSSAFAAAGHVHTVGSNAATDTIGVSSGSWGSALSVTMNDLTPTTSCGGIRTYTVLVTATATIPDIAAKDDVSIGITLADSSPGAPNASTRRVQTVYVNDSATLVTQAVLVSFADATPTVNLMLMGTSDFTQVGARGITAQHVNTGCLVL